MGVEDTVDVDLEEVSPCLGYVGSYRGEVVFRPVSGFT